MRACVGRLPSCGRSASEAWPSTSGTRDCSAAVLHPSRPPLSADPGREEPPARIQTEREVLASAEHRSHASCHRPRRALQHASGVRDVACVEECGGELRAQSVGQQAEGEWLLIQWSI